MFKNAIVRRPAKSMVDGISTANLGRPIYERALKQHDDYINALETCGVSVTVLEAEEQYPDSCFVEDTAILSANCAVLTNLGAESRKGEEISIHNALKNYYDDSNIHLIKEPGSIEGGDVMMVGNHYYIGLSKRTDKDGGNQYISILEQYGYSGSLIYFKDILHLKTGMSYLENNNLIAVKVFNDHPEFKNFNIIPVSNEESYSANCIWVNDKVIVPKGYAGTKQKIGRIGYEVIEVDMREFQKLDGGLSCLSLRF